MQPARVAVDPGSGAHFLGSDGMLEFDVPAGAVTGADVAAAGGSMSLLVRQVLPASGSSAGGSGHYSFGTYLVQLLDSAGKPARQGLRKSVSFTLHPDQRARALDLKHARVLINPSLPTWFDPNPPAALPALGTTGAAAPASSARMSSPTNAHPVPSSTTGTGGSTVKLGPAGHQAATADASGRTLSAVVSALSPSTGVSFDTDAPVATFGRPDPFGVGLSAGALTARYSIDVPAGPGGLTPPIGLAYSSAGVSEQHNPQGAAPWVGEGWNLSLGSISWAEHQVQSLCTNVPNPPCVHNPQWEDSWQLSDPFGTSADLVPPNINVETYLDDSTAGVNVAGDPFVTASNSNVWVRDVNGGLEQFVPNANGSWQAWNISAAASGVNISGTPFALSSVWAVDTGGHLRQFANGSSGWTAWDITNAAGGVTVAGDPYVTPAGNGDQVWIRDSGGHLRQFLNGSSGWTAWDLSAMAGGVNIVGRPLMSASGSVWAVDTGGHLRQFANGPSGWTAWDITNAAGGVAVAGDPYITPAGNGDQVWIRDSGGHLRQFLNGSSGWTAWDLSAMAGGVNIVGRPFTSASGSVWAEDASGHLRQFTNGSSGWTAWDITNAAGGVTIAADPYVTPVGNGDQVWVPDSSGRLRQFVNSSGWDALIVSALANRMTSSPITWHTAPETRARIVSFTGPNTLPGMGAIPPCFRVFLPSGIMEEFGCTPDSLQFYPQPTGPNSGLAFVANWLLDLITDPSGNQVHVTYQQDLQSGAGGMTYPRDAVPATVEWDSPGCLNAQAACTGSAWAPLMQVSFAASHTVAHTSGSSCAANGSLRCDDPVDLSGSGGIAAPTIQSTFVLNDVAVQVRGSASAGWNTLRDYRLSYDQSGPGTITDPVSGSQQSVAGRLVLTQLKGLGADGTTALPASTFQYTQVPSYYEDSLVLPNPATNCGPSWNTGNGKGCVLWSQSYAGNSSYLSSVSNGLGLTQTFGWQLARNNFHGVNGGGGNITNPFYCNGSGVASTYPCNMPDDETWSRVVLTQRSDTTVRLSQAGQGGIQSSTNVTGTTAYGYQVTYPLLSPQCSSCQAISYWGNQNDNDYLDFYNYRFVGFAQATVSLPDGSAQVHKFFTTQGTGLYDVSQIPCIWGNCHDDPFWNTPNAAHGHEYELDQYGTDGTTLLRKVTTKWAATCPPAGVGGTPYSSDYGTWWGNLVTELDHSNPVAVCEINPRNVDRYTFDGSGSAAHSATAYSYDGYGRVATEADIADTGSTAVADSSGHGNAATLSGGVTEGVPGLVGDGDAAMTFDGASGSVTGPVLGPLQGDNTRSVEFWFSTTSRAQQALLDGGNTGVAGQAFQVGLTTNHGGGGNPPANRPGLYVSHAGDDVLLSDLTLTDGRPHHVVVTLSGTSLYVYVDGQTPNGQVWNGSTWTQPGGQPFALPSAPNTAASPLWIGRTRAPFWGNGSPYFDGTIDEVAVYGAALSSARVQAHYGAGSGYRSAVLADSPTAYYRLDDGTGGPGPNTIVHRLQYIWNDSVNATASSATGTYIIDRPAFDDVEDLAGNRYQCTYTSYDGQGFTTGQSGGLTRGLATTGDRYTGCGNAGNGFTPSGQVRTTHTYDAFGNQFTTNDPDANAGNSAHVGCSVGSASYSSCTTHDGTFEVLPTRTANALSQASTITYQTPNSSPMLVADSSGHGNQASRSGGVVEGMPGLVSGDPDTAMGFDGSTGTIPLNLAGIDTGSGHQVTVEFWMKWSGSGSGQMPFGFNTYDLYLLPGTGFGFNTSAGDIYGVPMSAVPANTPLHVVAVFTNGGVGSNLLYINGVQQTLTQLAGTPLAAPAVTAAANVSGWAVNGNYRFSGTLDEVAVYNGALSSTRVSAHYGAGSGYRSAVLADSPLAYYRLDEGTTTALGGFGLWPISKTDANGQTTTMTYDALGRETSETLPGEGAGLTTLGTGYTVWCSGTAAQAPCCG